VCVFLSDLFLIPTVIFLEKRKGMSSSDSVSLSTSSSESIESGRSRGRYVKEESTSSGGVVGGIPMETVIEVREDPPEELAESNWLAKDDYGWVAADVRNQSSLFRWSRLLNSWLNCTPVIAKGVSGSIVSLERVSVIDRVCHGQEGGNRKVLLYVHVPLLSATCAVVAGRFHHGCVACAKRRTYAVAPKQLGLYASLPRFESIPISAAFSLCISILL